MRFLGAAVVETLVLVWLAIVLCLAVIVIGLPLVPHALDLAGHRAQRSRSLVRRLGRPEIDAPYRPVSGAPGWGGVRHSWQRLRDPIVQRDPLWALVDPVVGLLLATLSLGLVAQGVWELIAIPFQLAFPGFEPATWLTLAGLVGMTVPVSIVVSLVTLTLQIVIGLAIARPMLAAQLAWTRSVLQPGDAVVLRERVDRLETTRADALTLERSELDRIERDLHDGAQMRFVATGLTISEAARLVHDDPQRAVELLRRAQDESASGLAELRSLVRGIRPPVLADRGLVDAVRALAVESPLPVTVTSSLSRPLAEPLEAALYFAVAELLTNAIRHADATAVTIDLGGTARVVVVRVEDDGRGGADDTRESGGLAGIRRRLGVFDGELALHSPLGGPTVATITTPRVDAPGRPAGVDATTSARSDTD